MMQPEVPEEIGGMEGRKEGRGALHRLMAGMSLAPPRPPLA